MNPIVHEHIEQKTFFGKQGVVIGTGKSGLAAARLLHVLGAKVRIVDSNPNVTEDILGDLKGNVELMAGPHDRSQFSDADIVIPSPGVPVRKMADVLGDVPTQSLMAEVEFASWFTDSPILAITGSNGKTTTTTLVSAILKDAGKTVFTGGNIGTPLSEHVLEAEHADVVVLELSSFQLQNCRTLKPRVGIFLNLSANHLDYHEDMEEYLDAKLVMFSRMTGEDTALMHESLREIMGDRGFTNAYVEWFGPTEAFDAPFLPGKHNQSNIQAAWLAAKLFGVTEEQAGETIRNFKSLEHRLEQVGEVDGVLYVNDTKATTLVAAEAAVKSFDRPVRLLMGGKWKGGDVESFAKAIKGRVAHIGLYGGGRDAIESTLSNEFPVTWDQTLEDAMNRQRDMAADGDVILLSPGMASFDQYNNYEERGHDFKRVVEGLA